MGFFDNWKVTFITTDAAKTSSPFYELAIAIDTGDDEIPIELQLKCGHIFLKMKQSFDLYFSGKMKSEKHEAVKFLVAFTSYLMGKDQMGWNWEKVRHHSQGLYGSMEETPSDFNKYNIPLIKRCTDDITEFISAHS